MSFLKCLLPKIEVNYSAFELQEIFSKIDTCCLSYWPLWAVLSNFSHQRGLLYNCLAFLQTLKQAFNSLWIFVFIQLVEFKMTFWDIHLLSISDHLQSEDSTWGGPDNINWKELGLSDFYCLLCFYCFIITLDTHLMLRFLFGHFISVTWCGWEIH